MTMALMVTIATQAAATTFEEARQDALFLTDKMTYELGLSTVQANNVYEINLDYVVGVTIQGVRLSTAQQQRDADLRYVLSDYQYYLYKKTKYFYRPMASSHNAWSLTIYNYYTDRNRMMAPRPSVYTDYRGQAQPRKGYAPPANPQAGKQMRRQQQQTVRTNPHSNQPINPHSNQGRK